MDIRRVKFEWGEWTLFIVKFNHVIIFHNGDAMKPICELHLTQKAESDFQIIPKLTQIGRDILEILQNIPGDYQLQQKPYSLHTESDGDASLSLYRDFICVRARDNALTLQMVQSTATKRLWNGFYCHRSQTDFTNLILSFDMNSDGVLSAKQSGKYAYTENCVQRIYESTE